MSYENLPDNDNAGERTVVEKNNRGRNILTAILVIALLGTWGYIIFDKNKTRQEKQDLTSQIVNSDSAKNELQRELDDAALRLDALKTSNVKADSLLKTKDKDIDALKARVQSIINNRNATRAELAEAKRLIAQLKGNIETYTAQIDSLQTANSQLTETNRVVTQQRDVVQKSFDSASQVIQHKDTVIDIGSTLDASNFSIEGIKEKHSGKEKVTSTAKRVDKLSISFTLGANRITPSGPKDIYVCITDPTGKPVQVDALGSGTFTTRDGVQKPFTKKIEVNYVQGQKQPVKVEWSQNSKFITGGYKVEIYNNGFKIGEGVVTLKKGGLFS
ncbi:MAG: coiled-coil domain-containing protein [Ginsengibacter sp.]